MGQKNLPLASGEAHAKAFARAGWVKRKVTKGLNPHIIMTRAGFRATLSIPSHSEVKRVLLQTLIQAAQMTEAEYLGHFRKK